MMNRKLRKRLATGDFALSVGRRVAGVAICCLLLLAVAPARAADPFCLADTFADALQTHDSPGSIYLKWNAQVRNNPDNVLGTSSYSQNGGSTVLSCETADCVGSTDVNPQLLPSFVTTGSSTDLESPFAGQASLGTAGEREYRSVWVKALSNVTADDVSHDPTQDYVIDQLTVGYRATLNLRAGNYWVRNLTIRSLAKINVVGPGTVRLFVQDPLIIGYRAKLNPQETPVDASKLLLVTYGSLQTYAQVVVNAVVYGKSTAQLGYRSSLTGSLAAANIVLNSQATIDYQAPDASADFGPFCAGAPVNPPVLSITAPADGMFTNDSQQTIELDYSSDGTIDTGSIELTLDANPLDKTCIADQISAQCTPNNDLPEGMVTIGATVADTQGQVSNSDEVTFTVDTIPPEVVINQPLDNSETNDSQQAVSGNVSEDVQSLLLNINNNISSIAADTNNDFDEQVTLNEGGNQITVTASDFASNLGSDSVQVTLDTVVPNVAVAGQIDVGPYSNGETTIIGSAGSVEPNATVIITNLRTGEVFTVVADANGAFNATVTGLEGDDYRIVVQDAAGNQSAAIEVTNEVVNLPPEITSVPTIGGTIDVPYTYQILATDPNNDVLAFSFIEKPLGMNVDANGLVTWLPINDGDYPVSILVSDGNGGDDTQSYSINIVGEAAQTPTLGNLSDQTALLGRTLSLQLTASDPDNDAIEFFVAPLPLADNMTLDSNTGLFTFTPDGGQVGSYPLTFMATDGRFTAQQTITITVPPPLGVTQLRGRVLTSNDAPLPGVRLEMGGVETLSDANGDFFLDNIPVSGRARLLVDGNVVDPALGAFATVPEVIDIIEGTENILTPEIFLLPLDVASADPVDPATTSIITSSRFTEGLSLTEPVTLTIPPGRAIDDNTGLPYVGDIHISRVTDPTKGPRPLPEEFDLSVYIAIQPFGVTYPDPVPISFPNIENFPPGSRLDFFALDHDTGIMEKIGEGLVSADGKTVDSIGGVVKSNSWHGIVPQGPVASPNNPPSQSEPGINSGGGPHVQGTNGGGGNNGGGGPSGGNNNPSDGNGGNGNGGDDNGPDQDPTDPDCGDGCFVDRDTGNLKEWHQFPAYSSLQQTRLLKLEYNSNIAAPSPIIPLVSGFGNQAPPPELMSMRINIDGIDMGAEVFSEIRIEPSNIPGQFKITRPAIQFNASMIETGIYDYELDINCYFPVSRRLGKVNDQVIIHNERNSYFGAGWSIPGLQRVYEDASGSVLLTEGTATSLIFQPLDPLVDPNGFVSPPGDFSTLRRLGDGTLERRMKDGTLLRFDVSGLLDFRFDRNNNQTDYVYDSQQRLVQIVDPVGLSYDFTYLAGRLETVTDPLGRVTRFEHDSEGNLISIIEPNGDRRVFEYEVGSSRMVAQLDQRQNRTEYVYNFAGRISETILPDGSNPKFAVGQVKGLADVAPEGQPGDGSRDNPTPAPLLAEEVNNSYVDRNGNETLEVTDIRHAPLLHTDALGREYSYTRDEDSNVTQRVRPNASVVDNTFDDQGNMLTRNEQFNSAMYQYTYDDFGLMTSYTNPNGHTTTYNRDPLTGNTTSVVNHLGHTTTFEYDIRGLVERMVTANQLEIVYTYTSGGLVETITETPPANSPGGIRLTQFSYDAAGQLVQSISPDGITLNIEYDEKGRRTRITDQLNQVIEFFYDASDNLIRTDTRNSDGSIALSVQSVFDTRNRLIDSILPHTADEDSITQRILDNNNNVIGLTDPNGNDSSNEYDAEDRLTKSTHRLNGEALFEYDDNDRIVKRTAPNGVVTEYTYDVLGRLLTETSADRGTITYGYDANNNLTSITDARGINVTLTYDELERPVSKLYPNTIAGKQEDVVYVYDNCAFGIGRLCQRTDESGSWSYEYDAYGNVVRLTRVELGVTYITEYQYDDGNNVSQIVYPSGRVIDIARDGVRRIQAITTDVNSISTDIIDEVQYRADNQAIQMTFGNGLLEQREYDLQGRLLNQDLGSLDSRSYSYDKNGNLLSRTTTPQNSVYSYDALDRLVGDQINGDPGFDYSYDLNHNRQSKSQSTTVGESYNYGLNSNRLIRHQQFNQNSLPDQVDDRLYVYSDSSRLFQVFDDGLLTAEYVYNDQGQRTRKVVYDNAVTPAAIDITIFHYDLQGNLIAETDELGTPRRDYLWTETMAPIAQIDIGTGNDSISYLHTDQLSTPRLATNTGQQIVWRWEGDAFGSDEDQIVQVEVNLRFPGQYLDRETGNFYNWNRYYNPILGRYLSSDPIGMGGGPNTFVYAKAGPTTKIDPTGQIIPQETENCRVKILPGGDPYSTGITHINWGPLYYDTVSVPLPINSPWSAGVDITAVFNITYYSQSYSLMELYQQTINYLYICSSTDECGVVTEEPPIFGYDTRKWWELVDEGVERWVEYDTIVNENAYPIPDPNNPGGPLPPVIIPVPIR